MFTVVPSMVRENRACAPVVGCLRPHSPPPFRPAALPPLVAAIPRSPRASSTSTGVYIHDIEVRALCSCVLSQGCSRSAACALCSPRFCLAASFTFCSCAGAKSAAVPGFQPLRCTDCPGQISEAERIERFSGSFSAKTLRVHGLACPRGSTRSLSWVGAQGAADVCDLRGPVVRGDAEAVHRLPVSAGWADRRECFSKPTSGATGAHAAVID